MSPTHLVSNIRHWHPPNPPAVTTILTKTLCWWQFRVCHQNSHSSHNFEVPLLPIWYGFHWRTCLGWFITVKNCNWNAINQILNRSQSEVLKYDELVGLNQFEPMKIISWFAAERQISKNSQIDSILKSIYSNKIRTFRK